MIHSSISAKCAFCEERRAGPGGAQIGVFLPVAREALLDVHAIASHAIIMSVSFLSAKGHFAADAAALVHTPPPIVVRDLDDGIMPRPPPIELEQPNVEDMEIAVSGVLSCARTAIAVTRFLNTPMRRSCSFVNPNELTLAELSRTAKSRSLSISLASEQNVGSVVRLSRLSCSEPYPMDQSNAPSPAALPPSPFKRGSSFNSDAVVDQARRVVSGAHERPKLTDEGSGGVYMIRESTREWSERMSERSSDGGDEPSPLRSPAPIAVFKPADEEAGSQNNPRGLVGADHLMRQGFRPGGGAVRERVAYKLDRGFARVPRTAIDSLVLPSPGGAHLRSQSGSIQEFVPSDGDASDFRFDGSEFDEEQSQRVMLMDMRLFNTDRHEGNLLVRRPRQAAGGAARCEAKCDVVPIDHAFCLPSFGYFREAEFAWRYWTSAAKPFGAAAVKYVAALREDDDVATARRAGLDESSCATLRACTLLLQRAVLGPASRRKPAAGNGADAAGADAAGNGADPLPEAVTPKAVSALLMRDQFDEPSPFERLCARALGVPGAEHLADTGLIDFVQEQQRKRGASADAYVPPPEFYERFEALLEAEAIL